MTPVNHTRIKICGITRQSDADAVARAGADALGLNFVPGSPREVDCAVAAPIARSMRDTLARVGLFVDPPRATVEQVVDQVELDLLQFHGNEPGDFCRSFGLPYLKVFRVRGPLDMDLLEAEYADACCLLLDAYLPGRAGGTGQRFDWSHWPRSSTLPLVLAGGLTPENVRAAIDELRPWGVDVAGGVEGTTPGRKDPARIQQFIEEVRGGGS